MSHLPQVYTRTLEGGEQWQVTKTFYHEIGNFRIIVPQSFVFDFASIPRIAWTIIGSPATGKHRIPALIHDWLYASEMFERSICDEVFYMLLRQYGVSWLKSKAMYYAVRLGGSFVWAKHDKDMVDYNRFLLKEAGVMR